MTFPAKSAAPRASEHLVRAVVAELIGEAESHSSQLAKEILAKMYPDDRIAPVLLRAAQDIAALGSSQWTASLTTNTVADFVTGLGPVSAAAQLIAMSLQIDLANYIGVAVPAIMPAAGYARFVAEGKPIPVAPLLVNGPILRLHKIAAIVPFSRETVMSTAVEPIVRQLLRESVGLSLDAAMFSSLSLIDDERPAGLLNGITPLTATAGGGADAMIGDLEALAGAVAPVAGSAIAFVAAPNLALKLALRRADMPYRVLASGALAADTIMAVATNALVTAIDPAPEFSTSKSSVLHMESSPSQISTAGSPNTVAAPTKSMFQVDAIALRIILGASWALRVSGAVAVVNGATW